MRYNVINLYELTILHINKKKIEIEASTSTQQLLRLMLLVGYALPS